MSDLSRERRIILGYPKGPDGRPVCRWCRGPVPSGRRLWCSQKCVDEYRLRNDPAFIRHKVYERDHGICQQCGVDTEAIEAHEQHLKARAGGEWWEGGRWVRLPPAEQAKAQADHRDYVAWMQSRGLSVWRSNWEADHIVEVVNGGAELGLANFQTLCPECHKRKTAKLAADRALARRLAKQPELCLK